jgi:CRISPR-associated protein Csd1
MEVGMALNTENKSVAYRLGRLFAVLEKAQKDAVPGAGATIKDRFYGSASATPRKVFPQLLRLAQHHIQKSKFGHLVDKKIEEIVQEIQDFPAHLNLDDQGLFALGYYHQRQALFVKPAEK